MFDDGFDLLIEYLREVHLTLQDVLVNDHRVLVSERIDPCVHLVDQNAQGPPIHAFSVPLVQQNLRGEVLWRSTERISPRLNDLRKAKIGQLEVSIIRQQ